MENLYQILKKNVEAQLKGSDEKLYTQEYDQAVFEYMSHARSEQEWIEQLNALREMEKSIAQYLVQQAMAQMARNISEMI